MDFFIDEDRRTRENYTEQQIQNEAGECNISRRATHSHHTPIQKDVTAAEDRTFNSSCTQDINQDNRGTLEAPYPVENNTRDKISFKETRKSDTQQPSNDLKSEASQGRGTSSVYHNDFRFRLRLRVHYRINEEAIRCLLLLRWVGRVHGVAFHGDDHGRSKILSELVIDNFKLT